MKLQRITNWFKERNNWHYLLGTLLAILFYIAAYQAYEIVGRVLVSAAIVVILAIGWEIVSPMVRTQKDGSRVEFDWADVRKSFVGIAIGEVLAVIVHLITLNIK